MKKTHLHLKEKYATEMIRELYAVVSTGEMEKEQ